MFESLHPLSDSQIISGSKAARAQEHDGMIALLGFIAEVERRTIYLALGYSSLFEYCTQYLEESESAAMRRIVATRCVMRFPQVFPLLQSKEISLSTIGKVAKILTEENCAMVLQRIRRKSAREAEAIAAEYQLVPEFPKESVRTLVAKVPATPAVTGSAPKDNARLGDFHLRSGGKELASVDESTPAPAEEVQLERRSVLTIPADDEFMEMLAHVRELASHQLRAGMGMQDVLKIAMRYYIRQKDPNARVARRATRSETRSETRSARSGIQNKSPKAAPNNPRHIPVTLRDQVYARDQRCTYVGPDGKRCNSTHVLQVDHIRPVARRGAAVIDNLRLLCAEHNRLESERLMGRRDIIREPRAGYKVA